MLCAPAAAENGVARERKCIAPRWLAPKVKACKGCNTTIDGSQVSRPERIQRMIPAAPPIIISPSGQTGRANVGRARTTRSRQRCPQPKACQSSSPRNQAGASKEFQNRNRFGDWLAVPRHRRQNRKPSIVDEGAHIRKPARAAGRLPLLRNSEGARASEAQRRREPA